MAYNEEEAGTVVAGGKGWALTGEGGLRVAMLPCIPTAVMTGKTIYWR